MLLNLLCFLVGFLAASVIDTSLGEFNEWAVVGAALVIATVELFNNIYFRIRSLIKNYHINLINNWANLVKVGFIYGLIVDAFKLGS